MLGDLGASAGQGLAMLLPSVEKMVELLTQMGSWELPAWAKTFILSLLIFGLNMLRFVIVMVLLSLHLIVMEAVGGMIGGALLLLLFLRYYNPMRWFMDKCGKDWHSCVRAPIIIPVLPQVPIPCDRDLCELLRHIDRTKIGVVGVCGTVSVAGYAIEGAFTYCELEDIASRYAWTITISAMFAAGEGESGSLGLLFGLDMDNVADAAGFSVVGDLTLAMGDKGGDVNASVNPLGYSGVAFTVSPAGGSEAAASLGVAGTYLGRQPIGRGWVFRPVVDFIANCMWKTADACG